MRVVPLFSPCLQWLVCLIASLVAHSGTAHGQCMEKDCAVIRHFSVPSGLFGGVISEVRDLDGDGASDLLASHAAASFAGANSGRVWVISTAGGADPYLLTFTGAAGDQLGWSLADAGRVGADAVPGIAAGAPRPPNSGGPGRVFVYSAVDGSLIHTLTGEAPNDRFGFAVGHVGDINGDGCDELIVGARLNDHQGLNSGRAYLYSGSDGSLMRTFEAEGAGHGFGAGVDGLGDVNGDDIPDVVVAAPFAPGPNGPGKLYAFSGIDGAPLWTAGASAGAAAFGTFFVADVGDVNRDGSPDVYVGDFSHGGGAGRAYVFCGHDGSVVHEFPGQPGEGLGPGRFAGDVDGDGYADLVVGAYTSSAGAAGGGRTYLFSGRNGSILRTITGNIPGQQNGFDACGLGDIDHDGKLDLAVSAASGNSVYVFAGTMTPLSPADLNDDGRVNVQDLLAVIGEWGGCDPSPKCLPSLCDGDLNLDGQVNVVDLLLVISNWSSMSSTPVP